MNMSLTVNLRQAGYAAGKYNIKAKGFFLSVLKWGNEKKAFSDWSPIGYIPIDPAGNGGFLFPGMRAIPIEATHIWAHCVSHDFSSHADISVPIPPKYLPHFPEKEDMSKTLHLSVLTDFHLSVKTGAVRRALSSAESEILLLIGDLTNDGLSEQFEQFQNIIDQTIPEKSIFCIPGNHDVLHPAKTEDGKDGISNYLTFREKILDKANQKGYLISKDKESLAYSVQLGFIDLIGLQCVISKRRFLFPKGRQIQWLETHLAEQKDAEWHIIMCHAPLLSHNPHRNDSSAYLDRDEQLQNLLDRTGNIIFLSGHTHISPNLLSDNGAQNDKTGNIYLDCGSVADTHMEGLNSLSASDWKDGCITELVLSENLVEICMKSIDTGKKFPRGYYRFYKKNDTCSP